MSSSIRAFPLIRQGTTTWTWIATAPSYAYKLYAHDLGTQSVASAISSAPTVTVNSKIINLLYVTAALNDQGDVLGVIVTNTDVSNDWTASLTLEGLPLRMRWWSR